MSAWADVFASLSSAEFREALDAIEKEEMNRHIRWLASATEEELKEAVSKMDKEWERSGRSN